MRCSRSIRTIHRCSYIHTSSKLNKGLDQVFKLTKMVSTKSQVAKSRAAGEMSSCHGDGDDEKSSGGCC